MTAARRVPSIAAACSAALLLCATTASGQPQAPQPPPPDDDRQPPPPDYRPPPPRPYQPQPQHPKPTFEREGWFLGFGVGIGSLTLSSGGQSSDALGGVLGEVHFGGMVTSKLALVLELWGGSHEDNQDSFSSGASLGQSNFGFAGQYFATPRLWLKGGIGAATLSRNFDGDTISEAKGTSFLAALGYELVQRTSLAIDVQVRLTAATYKDDFGDAGDSTTVSLQVGFSWY